MSEEAKGMKYCPDCDQTFAEGTMYCSECGQKTVLRAELVAAKAETTNIPTEKRKQTGLLAALVILIVALTGAIVYFNVSINTMAKETKEVQEQLAVKDTNEEKWQDQLAGWTDPDAEENLVQLKDTLAQQEASIKQHESDLQEIKEKTDPLNKAYEEAKAAEGSNDMTDVINKYNTLYQQRNTHGTTDVNELKKSLLGASEGGGERQ